MMSLQLDRIPLSNEYLRLPRELLDCCAAAATRPHMTKDLIAAMQRMCLDSDSTDLRAFPYIFS